MRRAVPRVVDSVTGLCRVDTRILPTRLRRRTVCSASDTNLHAALTTLKQRVEATGAAPTAQEVEELQRRFGIQLTVNDRMTDVHVEAPLQVVNEAGSDTSSQTEIEGPRTPGEKMALQFTCSYDGCDLPEGEDRRSTKLISKNSYENGVVLVMCHCKNFHLIADNLRWFEETATNIEDIMAAKGENVRKLQEQDIVDIES